MDIAPSPAGGASPTTLGCRGRCQFRLRTALLLMLVLCAVLAVIGLKLRQDHRHRMAWLGLQRLGVRATIHSLPGHRVIIKLASTRPELRESDVEQLLSHVETLGRLRDWGFTRGAEIVQIDLTASRVSESALARLRGALPDAEIRR